METAVSGLPIQEQGSVVHLPAWQCTRIAGSMGHVLAYATHVLKMSDDRVRLGITQHQRNFCASCNLAVFS